MYAYTCLYVFVHINMYIKKEICICIYFYTHTHMYIYIYICTYIYISYPQVIQNNWRSWEFHQPSLPKSRGSPRCLLLSGLITSRLITSLRTETGDGDFIETSSNVEVSLWLNVWLVGQGHPSETYESQLGWLFLIHGKIKNGNQTTNQLWMNV